MLTRNLRQEALSRAYILAVVSRPGMGFSIPCPDSGIDLGIHDIVQVGTQRIESGYRIDIQARSTSLAHIDAETIRYDLDIATYELLRYPAGASRLLVVMLLPDKETDWLVQSEEQMLLRHAAYWTSLRGRKATGNRRSVRISIPRINLFTPEVLRQLMDRIKGGEEI